MKNCIKEKGITLIALVVTIVVLIILSSVSINTLFGENGLISKAKEATTKYSEAEKDDLESLKNLENFMDKELTDIETTSIESEIKPGEKAVGGNKKYISDGKIAIIPEGFAISKIEGEETINNGLVIYDLSSGGNINWSNADYMQRTYNQFVWIPVENEFEYVRTFKDYTTNYSASKLNTYSDVGYLPEGTFNLKPLTNSKEDCENAERTAVVASKGFYIGRYEAGGTEGNVTCKKDAVLVNITQENSKKESKKMYNDQYKASALCSGIQWDMVMQEIDGKNDGSNDTIKTYNVREKKDTRHNSEGVKDSANNPIDRVYNIFDLEGNVYEYVAEKNDSIDEYVKRGSSYSNFGPACNRRNSSGITNLNCSFRPVLYVR